MATVGRGSEFIEIDRGGTRLTHHPSGDTLLKHGWLGEDRNFERWDGMRRAFFGRHPGVHALVVLDRLPGPAVVGDVRDFPWVEGFKVGDAVVTTYTADRSADCARRIVGELPNGDPAHRSKADHDVAFLLEDGEVLYWSSMEDCWHTRSMGGERRVRARRPWPGEDVEALRIPDGDMLAKAMPNATEVMNLLFHALGPDHPIGRDEAERAFRRMEVLLPLLEAEQIRVCEARKWHDRHEPVRAELASLCAGALEEAGRLARRAEEAGLHLGYEQPEAILHAEAVVATMRERGTCPPADPAARYGELVDRKHAGGLTAAEAEEMERLGAELDARLAPHDQAVIDRLRREIGGGDAARAPRR